MEHCLIYFSRSIKPFDEDDLAVILQQSHRNNAKTGISGVLLYVRGSIIQVLEGEKSAVEFLYSRIQQDQRHADVNLILNRPISQRLFGNWGMGYETLTARQFEAVRAIINLDDVDTADKPDDPLTLKTIKVFYNNNRFN